MERTRDFFKIKAVLFLGYDGRSFNGMQFQRQQGAVSIENTLLQAMIDAGLLRKENMQELKRVHLSRGARTDKRVHALLNGISIKVDVLGKYLKDRGDDKGDDKGVSKAEDKGKIDWQKIIGELNGRLPPTIRIFSGKVVTKGFDIRHDSKHRIYVYLMPAFVFNNKEQLQQPDYQSPQQKSKQLLGQLSELVQLYKGTNCYNNFTRGYKPDDKRCVRYIMDMGVSLERVKGSLFFRFKLKGQSFIYHQIRKMVGLVVQLYCEDHISGVERNLAQKKEEIKKALKVFGKKVYLAPGEGLYLESLGLQSYSSRDNIPQPLLLNAAETAKSQKFRTELEESIESQGKVFLQWIKSHLNQQTYLEGVQEESGEKMDDG